MSSQSAACGLLLRESAVPWAGHVRQAGAQGGLGTMGTFRSWEIIGISIDIGVFAFPISLTGSPKRGNIYSLKGSAV